MTHRQCTDREEPIRLNLDQTIHPNNPVRVIDVYADSLDLDGLGFHHVVPAETGSQSAGPPARRPWTRSAYRWSGCVNTGSWSRNWIAAAKKNIDDRSRRRSLVLQRDIVAVCYSAQVAADDRHKLPLAVIERNPLAEKNGAD